jgi:hypothetical protein
MRKGPGSKSGIFQKYCFAVKITICCQFTQCKNKTEKKRKKKEAKSKQ